MVPRELSNHDPDASTFQARSSGQMAECNQWSPWPRNVIPRVDQASFSKVVDRQRIAPKERQGESGTGLLGPTRQSDLLPSRPLRSHRSPIRVQHGQGAPADPP